MPDCDTGLKRIFHPKQIHRTLERYNDTETVGVSLLSSFLFRNTFKIKVRCPKNASCLVQIIASVKMAVVIWFRIVYLDNSTKIHFCGYLPSRILESSFSLPWTTKYIKASSRKSIVAWKWSEFYSKKFKHSLELPTVIRILLQPIMSLLKTCSFMEIT